MPLDGRPHQRSLTMPALASIRIGSVFEQELYHLCIADTCGSHEHRLTVAESGIGIRAGLEQRTHDRGIILQSSFVKRNDSEAIRDSRTASISFQ